MSFAYSVARSAFVLVALLCCASITSAAENTRAAQIEITKFAFQPKELTVAPGTKIVWINHDETPHTVSASDKSFVSKGMDTDDRYEHTFDKEGDFAYFCTVHPYMTGTVHVHKP